MNKKQLIEEFNKKINELFYEIFEQYQERLLREITEAYNKKLVKEKGEWERNEKNTWEKLEEKFQIYMEAKKIMEKEEKEKKQQFEEREEEMKKQQKYLKDFEKGYIVEIGEKQKEQESEENIDWFTGEKNEISKEWGKETIEEVKEWMCEKHLVPKDQFKECNECEEEKKVKKEIEIKEERKEDLTRQLSFISNSNNQRKGVCKKCNKKEQCIDNICVLCKEREIFSEEIVKHGDKEECYKMSTIYKCTKCNYKGQHMRWQLENKVQKIMGEDRYVCCNREKDIVKEKVKGDLKKSNNGYYECCKTGENKKDNNRKYFLCNLCNDIVGGKNSQARHHNRGEEMTSECMDNRSYVFGDIPKSYQNSHMYKEVTKEIGEKLLEKKKELGSHRYSEYYNYVNKFVI